MTSWALLLRRAFAAAFHVPSLTAISLIQNGALTDFESSGFLFIVAVLGFRAHAFVLLATFIGIDHFDLLIKRALRHHFRLFRASRRVALAAGGVAASTLMDHLKLLMSLADRIRWTDRRLAFHDPFVAAIREILHSNLARLQVFGFRLVSAFASGRAAALEFGTASLGILDDEVSVTLALLLRLLGAFLLDAGADAAIAAFAREDGDGFKGLTNWWFFAEVGIDADLLVFSAAIIRVLDRDFSVIEIILFGRLLILAVLRLGTSAFVFLTTSRLIDDGSYFVVLTLRRFLHFTFIWEASANALVAAFSLVNDVKLLKGLTNWRLGTHFRVDANHLVLGTTIILVQNRLLSFFQVSWQSDVGAFGRWRAFTLVRFATSFGILNDRHLIERAFGDLYLGTILREASAFGDIAAGAVMDDLESLKGLANWRFRATLGDALAALLDAAEVAVSDNVFAVILALDRLVFAFGRVGADTFVGLAASRWVNDLRNLIEGTFRDHHLGACGWVALTTRDVAARSLADDLQLLMSQALRWRLAGFFLAKDEPFLAAEIGISDGNLTLGQISRLLDLRAALGRRASALPFDAASFFVHDEFFHIFLAAFGRGFLRAFRLVALALSLETTVTRSHRREMQSFVRSAFRVRGTSLIQALDPQFGTTTAVVQNGHLTLFQFAGLGLLAFFRWNTLAFVLLAACFGILDDQLFVL